jgi:hypothetical protein
MRSTTAHPNELSPPTGIFQGIVSGIKTGRTRDAENKNEETPLRGMPPLVSAGGPVSQPSKNVQPTRLSERAASEKLCKLEQKEQILLQSQLSSQKDRINRTSSHGQGVGRVPRQASDAAASAEAGNSRPDRNKTACYYRVYCRTNPLPPSFDSTGFKTAMIV